MNQSETTANVIKTIMERSIEIASMSHKGLVEGAPEWTDAPVEGRLDLLRLVALGHDRALLHIAHEIDLLRTLAESTFQMVGDLEGIVRTLADNDGSR